MKNIRAVLFLVPFLFLSLVAAADKDAMEKLVQVDKEIAELQARINAIQHIKMYAESVNLYELQTRDVEQTVAHFVKATRPGHTVTKLSGSVESQAQHPEGGAVLPAQIKPDLILNQIIGKSVTTIDDRANDFVFVSIGARSFKHMMQTTVQMVTVVSPKTADTEPEVFHLYDQDGAKIIEHQLTKQVCAAGSTRQLVKSENPNDMVFGLLCEGGPDKQNSTLGFYKLEIKDEPETGLKRISVGEEWGINLQELGLKTTGGVQSLILTRTKASKLKFVLATQDKIYVIATRGVQIDSQEDHTFVAPKLYPFTTGFAVLSANSITVKKLNSLGVVDENYAACSTISNLVDIAYDWKNPQQLYALTEATNEIYLFALQGSSKECHVAARNSLTLPSSDEKASSIDQIQMLGPLLVARVDKEPSLNVFMTDQENQLTFMRTEAIAATFKLTECADEETVSRMRLFSVTDSYITVETCQGQILNIQSSVKMSIASDENSWGVFFQKHFLKIIMTLGLVGTGVYQYFKLTAKSKQAKNSSMQSSGGRDASDRRSQKAASQAVQAAQMEDDLYGEEDDDMKAYERKPAKANRQTASRSATSSRGAPSKGSSQQQELDMLQQQLQAMESKIGSGGQDMAKMMEQLQKLSEQTSMIGQAAEGLSKKSEAATELIDTSGGRRRN